MSQEKETLLVEFQLVKMKLEREQKSGVSHPDSGRNQEADSTSLQGEDGAVSEGELVQKHFAGRVAELSSQVSCVLTAVLGAPEDHPLLITHRSSRVTARSLSWLLRFGLSVV